MLDPNGQKGSYSEAVQALNREEGVTIILITHYMEEVVDADYVLCHGSGQSRSAGHTEGDLLPGGEAEGATAGCAAGDAVGT